MRDLTPEFAEHIQSGSTTLANCWRLTRQDGTVLGFTDHDRALEFDGTIFSPTAGGDGGQVSSKLGGATDASDLIAIIADETISEDDLQLGRFDGAEVETWRVNWRMPEVRDLVRRDTVGEIVKADGMFRAELRSAQDQMNVRKGRLYQSLCGTSLGASPCGIDLDDPQYKSVGSIVALIGQNGLSASGLEQTSPNWFVHGKLIWTSGKRVGVADRVVAQKRSDAGDEVYLETEIGNWVQPGDTFEIFAGCDRQFSTCKAKFANQINFRGFPHIPGSDFVLTYPKSGSALAGAPLVK